VSAPHAPPWRRVAVLLASSTAFLLLARRAAHGEVSAGEERCFRSINTLSPALRNPAWLVMQAGSLPAVGVAAAVTLPRRRSTSVALASSGTAVWALSKLVKRIVRRGRPADHLADVSIHGATQRGAGFPSGHAAVATALAAVGSRVLPRPAAQAAWVTSALVCGTRQYVGAHLPLDVVGGAALGLAAAGVANLALDAVQ
jgi:membrane-associated phospholipid phosphatase